MDWDEPVIDKRDPAHLRWRFVCRSVVGVLDYQAVMRTRVSI